MTYFASYSFVTSIEGLALGKVASGASSCPFIRLSPSRLSVNCTFFSGCGKELDSVWDLGPQSSLVVGSNNGWDL